MIKACLKCGEMFEYINHQTRYCSTCKLIARKEVLARFAPKSRLRSKEYREKNSEYCKKIKKECYYNKREYYLERCKEYREKNKDKIKIREYEIRNQQPHRKILLDAGILPKCRGCGTYENHSGFQMSVHHIDGDHNNNVFDNLVWACESCHQYWHNPYGIKSELKEVKKYEKISRKRLSDKEPD